MASECLEVDEKSGTATELAPDARAREANWGDSGRHREELNIVKSVMAFQAYQPFLKGAPMATE